MEAVKKIKAIHNADCLCWKCLKEKSDIHNIKISDCGYGSTFDNFTTQIQLCEECFNESQKDKPIWCMDKVYGTMSDEYISKKDSVEFVELLIDKKYKYDEEMTEYINELPLESQELVYNTYGKGALAYHMNPQDWIDFKLGILPHEVCAEYGLYSPDEERAYKEKFPTCQYPIEIDYGNYVGCRCPFGAFGNTKDGVASADDNRMQRECYECTYYKERTAPIVRIKCEDADDFDLYMEYHLNKERLEQKFAEKLKAAV